MSDTGLDAFDATVQKSNAWLKRLMEIGGWEDRRQAYRALRATLHALRDRLTVEEAAELAAQMPMLIRGLYYEGWDPAGKPVRERHLDEFLGRIDRELRGDPPIDAETAARAVFRLLSERVSDGEIEDVIHLIPREIRTLWASSPSGARSDTSRTPVQ
jgi:uncharacterized protein (DUF2267 family)